MNSCRVDRAYDACRVAREQGCTPAEIELVIRHWQQHGELEPYAAWGPAALCWRIQHARPGMAVDRGWPKMSDAWLRHQASKRVDAQTVYRRREPPPERYTGSWVASLKQSLRERNNETTT